jgi:ribonucleoside-triphosphate reductase
VQATRRFELEQSFVEGYMGKQPEWGPVGYVTYKRTYARDLETIYPRHAALAREAGLEGNEEFWLTLVRVVEGTFTILANHCLALHLPWDWNRAQSKAQEMFRLMWGFKFLPPGRGLWMMGAPAVEKVGGAALNNCGFCSSENIDADFAAPFCMLMDYSMLGVGVGGDTRGAGKVKIVEPMCTPAIHYVEDTREGWVEVLRIILEAYIGIGSIPALDYSLVRPAGSPIRGFGGTASGPEPLMEMVISICDLLDQRIGEAITSSDIVDIFNLVGRCVVSGNVRRSAEILFGEATDDGFLELKDREKHAAALDSHRWASNNSVFATVGQSYTRQARLTAKNGEPGYFWLENAQKYGRMIDAPNFKDRLAKGGNPCLEQTLWDAELCNLVETFPAHHASLKDYLRTIKFAYLYAKVVTLVPTHNAKTNAVTLKNRRIGCSMSGIVQAVEKFGRRKFFEMCDEAYSYIQELDEQYSDWMCIPRSIKTTSVKPSGTVSLLPRSVTPGMHFPIAEYYWRVIRFATDSKMLPALRRAGHMCIDIDPAKEPNTTAVYFPVKVEDFDRAEKDVSMWEQLELAADMQAYWADNQVSVTVKFDKKTEGPLIGRALEIFETRLKGVSFLPHDDHGFDHAPYQPITEAEYLAAVAALTPLDLTGAVNEEQERFCDGDKCVMPTPAP